MWQCESHSVSETMAIGQTLAQHLQGGDLIALLGTLGAGKTQLVRGLATGMGIDPLDVASPTFVLIHEYVSGTSPGANDAPLVHIDAYRLTTLADLESIGWDRPMPDLRQESVVVIEWADRLGEELGDDYLAIALAHVGDSERNITITPFGPRWAERCKKLFFSLDQAMQNAKPNLAARPCPICKKPVAPHSPEFPFCSKRCRTIDLGNWASESYKISRPIERSDLEEGE